jgi:cobalt/nickel transport system permease protein
MKSDIPPFLLRTPQQYTAEANGKASRASLIDDGIERFAVFIRTTYTQWETANKDGLFQKLDARVKVVFLLFFIVIISVKKTLIPEVTIGGFIFILAVLSHISLFTFYKRVFFFGFVFGFLIALPSCLNIITKGEIVIPIAHLSKTYHFWIYEVPETIGITKQGLEGVGRLTLRVINSLSLSFLVIHTTPFPEIIRALKSIRVPDAFLMIITLSYKYIFVFAKIIEDVHLARKSRIIETNTAETRAWVAGRMAFLLTKTRSRCEEVFNAMLARGFSGAIALYAHGPMKAKDFIAGSLLFVAGLLFIIW